MEQWDVYDQSGNKLPGYLVRDQPIPQGCYHLVAEVLVRHTDGSYLLMQRSLKKKMEAGKFEASAGGSALQGESAIAAATRELQEETGITAPQAMTELFRTVDKNTIYVQFLCITDQAKRDIRLQAGETCAFRWLKAQDFKAFMNSDQAILSQVDRLKGYLNRL